MEFTEEQILLRALSRGDEKAFEVLFGSSSNLVVLLLL